MTSRRPSSDPSPLRSAARSLRSGLNLLLALGLAWALVACSSPSAVTTLNHNLGANQAAYAAYSPELDQALNSWWNGGAGGGSLAPPPPPPPQAPSTPSSSAAAARHKPPLPPHANARIDHLRFRRGGCY